MNTLGTRVKTLREKMKMTQQDLGDIVDLHGSNIGRIEKGKVSPASDTLLRMAIYFDVSCDWLLRGENAKTQICESADAANLMRLYRQLSPKDKIEIQELMEFKIYKTEQGKNNQKTSALTSTESNSHTG